MTTVAALNSALTGRYRIERELGGGGMAMVYLARDERHDRDVALKVLRPELAAVIGAERFLHEIKTTANLQHPHILPLHDSGNVDGTVWYVMPSVEGESLRDRLTRETQLPLDDALQVAREVAGALDYAHRHGVIHRDIKPENILLHDGRAMVADFGIALAVSKTEGGTRITETGMSLGTPHYMSPEQALGERTIDARTDVYALGCVLYEMLAGEPPFTGPSAQAIVAKVMNTVPAPVTATRPTVPVFVDAAIQRALSKLPADRFRSAAEFAAALQGTGAAAQGATTGTAAVASSTTSSKSSRYWIGAVPWVVAAAGVAWAGAVTLRAPAPDERVTAAILPLDIRTYRDAPVNEVGPDISLAPDGSFLVYVGADPESRTGTVLWRRPLDGLEATVIPGTRGAFWPFVTGDGLSVIYLKRTADGTSNDLWKVSLAGGLPTRAPMTWIPLRGGRFLIRADSRPEIVREIPRDADPAGGLTITQMRTLLTASVSPDFRYVSNVFRDSIVVRSSGPGLRAVVATGSTPTFLDNDLLAFRAMDGTLQVGRLSADRSRFTAPPVTVVPAVMASGAGAGVYSVGDDGTLVYRPGTASGESRLAWVDASGQESPVPNAAPRIYNGIALSPDERRAALSAGIVGRTSDVWLTDLLTGATTPLTRDGLSSRAVWRRDNRTLTWLHFNLLDGGRRGGGGGSETGDNGSAPLRVVSIRNVDASAGEDSLPGPWPRRVDELVWSPDEQFVAIRTQAPIGNRSIYVRRVSGDSLLPFAAEPAQERGPSFSPDGRWLLYVSDRSGRDEVYAESFPGGGNRTQVSLDGAREAVWSRDGARIYFRGLDGWMIAAHVTRSATLQVTRLERLFDASPYHANQFLRMYDVSRDGRFLMFKYETAGPRTDVVIIRNWVQQVKARLSGQR